MTEMSEAGQVAASCNDASSTSHSERSLKNVNSPEVVPVERMDSSVQVNFDKDPLFSVATPRSDQQSPEVAMPSPQKQGWLRRHWREIGCISIVVVIAAVLGASLGLKLHKHPQPPGDLAPGVWNGTGVVALDLGDGSDTIILYRQAKDGQIRRSEYLNGTWSGGQSADQIVSPNARGGTPLMVVSFVRNDELIWRVFYIDNNDILQESINSNKTQGGWSTGLLGAGLYRASSSLHVGLTACHNSQWYGAPYNISDSGLRLYYGAANSTVQELRWADGNGAWDVGSNFPDANGDGGVECTVAHSQPPSITNVWLLNGAGALEQRWMDFNLSANTSNHTTGSWVTGPSYPGVRLNSAISAITSDEGKLVHVQMPNSTVRELLSNGTAETSYFARALDVEGQTAIPGTKLGSVILNTTLGGQEIHLFYQPNASTVTDYVRTLDGETWSAYTVPIGP